MRHPGRVNMIMDGVLYETPAGDYLLDAAPERKFMLLVLAEDMTVEGGLLLADRIRERFPGCLIEYPDDTPPGDEDPNCTPATQAA